MGVVHIVLFEFESDAKPEDVQSVCQRMLALKDRCLHPTTKEPYLRMMTGGRDNSPEGLQRGFTHGFVVEFDNEEDRNYYVENDPAHREFVKSINGTVARAQVLDFAAGVFT